jgi:hypothetical protein
MLPTGTIIAFFNSANLKNSKKTGGAYMKKGLLAVVLGLGIMLSTIGTVGATVLTFDDLAGSIVPVPDGYGGLDWSNFYYLDTASYTASGYTNGMVSSDNVAFNAWGASAGASGSVFDFNGAYLTAAWNNGLNILIEGYNGSTLLYSQTVTVSTYSPTWFQLDYLGITDLTFTSWGGTNAGYSGNGTHFAMDDFTFNESTESTVPEPSTLLLLGAGMAGSGIIIRRRGK